MKKLLLSSIIAVFTGLLFAQDHTVGNNDFIYGKQTDFLEIQKRILVVQLLEEDAHKTKMYSKAKEGDYFATNYEKFAKQHNEYMKKGMSDFWQFNSSVEFKTLSEIQSIKNNKDTKYAVLELKFYSQFNAMFSATPIFTISRAEQKEGKADYKFYLPNYSQRISSNDKKMKMQYSDYKIALLLGQKGLDWNTKNKKALKFEDYADIMESKNCSQIDSKKSYVEEIIVDPKFRDGKALKEFGHEMEIVSDKQINDIVLDDSSNGLVIIKLPYLSSAGSETYLKIVYDVSKSEIVSYVKSNYVNLAAYDFKTLGKCK